MELLKLTGTIFKVVGIFFFIGAAGFIIIVPFASMTNETTEALMYSLVLALTGYVFYHFSRCTNKKNPEKLFQNEFKDDQQRALKIRAFVYLTCAMLLVILAGVLGIIMLLHLEIRTPTYYISGYLVWITSYFGLALVFRKYYEQAK